MNSMVGIDIICVGKLKEKFYTEAVAEYKKRLGAYCRLNIVELPETPALNQGEAERTLAVEAGKIREKIPKDAYVVCMCIEGRTMSSEELSKTLCELKCRGRSRLCFIIGSSFGISGEIKKESDLCLSMSKMTFPHHLARVMVLEQLYRSFKIEEGSGYHK